MINNQKLREIFDRTDGCCHFCGDPVVFDRYGSKDIDNLDGIWEADHIKQKAKGGTKDPINCLAACLKCNRLRWHRKGQEIRDLLIFGLIVKNEIKKGTEIGNKIIKLKEVRENNNLKRRRSTKFL